MYPYTLSNGKYIFKSNDNQFIDIYNQCDEQYKNPLTREQLDFILKEVDGDGSMTLSTYYYYYYCLYSLFTNNCKYKLLKQSEYNIAMVR